MSDWLDAEEHADRALEMYERGRWDEAESELRKALSLNPDQAEWHFNLGLTLEAAGRLSDALGCYERSIELMPDQAEPYVAAGVVANRLGRFQNAIVLFDGALKHDSSLEAAYAHKIDSHVRLGDHEEAETTFYLSQQWLAEPSAQCLAVMAESLIQRGMHDRAEWCLKEALRLEPNMPRLRARLAAVSAATGHPQKALQLFLRELRDDPGGIDTLMEYGQLLSDLGRAPEAAEKFRRVLELEPANVEAHFRLGELALAAHRYEQANLEFELVLKLDAQFPGIRVALGQTLLHRDRIDEARQLLLEEFETIRAALVETDRPSKPGGQSIPSVQSPQQTEQDTSANQATVQKPLFQPSIDEPQHAAASKPAMSHEATAVEAAAIAQTELVQLAELLLEAGEAEKASFLVEAALSRGETADLHRLLALTRFRAGDRDGGAAASRRVLRLDATCVRSMHNLALAALQERQLRAAAGWIQRGLKIDRHDDGLRRLRVRVWLAMALQFWRAWL